MTMAAAPGDGDSERFKSAVLRCLACVPPQPVPPAPPTPPDEAQRELEVLRRRLRRTQTLCANQLFDVRTRCLLRVCFHALWAARAVGDEDDAEDTLAWQSLPPSRPGSSASGEAGGEASGEAREWWAGEGEGDEGVGGLGLGEASGAATPISARTAGSPGSSRVGGLSSRSTVLSPSMRSVGSVRLSRYGERRLASSTASVAASRRSTGSALLELAEAEERHEAQIASFVGTIRQSKAKLVATVGRLRTRHTMRLCWHAIRAHAAEANAARGARHGVGVAARMSRRRTLRLLLMAWRLVARREADRRGDRQEIVAVVSERLAAAEVRCRRAPPRRLYVWPCSPAGPHSGGGLVGALCACSRVRAAAFALSRSLALSRALSLDLDRSHVLSLSISLDLALSLCSRVSGGLMASSRAPGPL
jgi:hypothetical protein